MIDVDCTAVVVTWRARDHIRECLDSLLAQSTPCAILIVDNASDDGTATILAGYEAAYDTVTVVRAGSNLGFAGGMHMALQHVQTPYVALLNDDAIADVAWLGALRAALDRHPAAAAATAKILLRSDGRVNNAGVALTRDGYGYDVGYGAPSSSHSQAAFVFGFCGGAALLRMDELGRSGGFPAEFFLYYEDTDTSWRLQLRGWSIVYEPGAVAHHRHAASSDPASDLFAFHNERNRLWMLLRCAPISVGVRALARFLLTTASLAVKSLVGRGPKGAQFRLRLRLRVLGATARNAGPLWRARRRTGAQGTDRARVWRQWAGTTAGPKIHTATATACPGGGQASRDGN